MPRGYDRALYILPFDHRASYLKNLFGWAEPLGETQAAEVIASKRIIYDGFLSVLSGGLAASSAGILVDEEFGAALLRDATARGVVTAAPTEKSGQEEFEFEYGDDFARHIDAFRPTFCKVLVRYNPDGDRAMNERQTARLRRVSEYLAAEKHSRFLFELLVPPSRAQLDKLKGDHNTYDLELRPELMVRAIRELQDGGVEPDVWKIEGLDRRKDCEAIVAAARAGGRGQVSCIVLGRGADDRKVRAWLTTAADVPGFIGFAVGRTTFWDALVAWHNKSATRAQAVAQIAARYREFVDLFEAARMQPQLHPAKEG